MGYRGIDVRQSGDRLLFRASLKDSSGAKLTTGTTTLRLFRLEWDGSLTSFDFSDLQFKFTTLSSPTLAMTHRTGDGGAYNTGIWTVALDLVPDLSSSSSSGHSSSSSSSSTSTSLSSSSTSTSRSSSSSSSSSSTSTSLSSSSSSSSSGHSSSSSSEGGSLVAGDIIIATVTNSGASPETQEREFQYGGGVLADIRQINGVDADRGDNSEIADSVLLRNWMAITDDIPERCLLQAARFLRNKWNTTAHAGEVTVYEEDDATEAYRKDITTDPSADPIVEA